MREHFCSPDFLSGYLHLRLQLIRLRLSLFRVLPVGLIFVYNSSIVQLQLQLSLDGFWPLIVSIIEPGILVTSVTCVLPAWLWPTKRQASRKIVVIFAPVHRHAWKLNSYPCHIFKQSLHFASVWESTWLVSWCQGFVRNRRLQRLNARKSKYQYTYYFSDPR